MTGYTKDFTKAGTVVPVDVETTAELVRQLTEAKAVIEWYGDEDNCMYERPRGAKAREYLEKLNQSNGEKNK